MNTIEKRCDKCEYGVPVPARKLSEDIFGKSKVVYHCAYVLCKRYPDEKRKAVEDWCFEFKEVSCEQSPK